MTTPNVFTVGDTAPALTGRVNADLTGATAAIHIRHPDQTTLSRAVTITDVATGAWSLEWQPGDLSVAGDHRVEVEVTYAGGAVQTFARSSSGREIVFFVRYEYA